ncbi:MAG: preprotein translocase subunit SecG [Campylobacterales bacterium]|nr:preprotein translocase subunit SecG [Campylobacterales bacterium]
MASTLVVVQFILGILITIAVLLQKSSSVGLGAYSGSNESVFGAKGANSFLVKVTVILAALFVINTVTLSFIYSSSKDDSVVDMVGAVPASPSTATPAAPAPVAPTAPAAPASK